MSAGGNDGTTGGGAWNWTALSQQAIARNTAHAQQHKEQIVQSVREAAAAVRRTAQAKAATKISRKPAPSSASTAASTELLVPPQQHSNPNVDIEAFSKLCITDRTVPASDLEQEMNGRKFIPLREMDTVSRDVLTDDSVDWVTIGVLARKTLSKATAQGSSFMVWALSDLNETELAVFLFDGAYNNHWRALEGSIVAVLNAPLMPANEKNKFALKVSKAEKVVVLGKAVDFGICKGTTSGEARCRLVVNTARSHYCLHHITSSFIAAGKRRQQLNNSFSTFNKSVFSGKNQLKNISAGVYGVRPTTTTAPMAKNGRAGANSGWQPIFTDTKNKRRRTEASSSSATGMLGVPTIISTTGAIVQRPTTSVPSSKLVPASIVQSDGTRKASSMPIPRATRGEKIIASMISSKKPNDVSAMLRAPKAKKVDMIKFMSSGSLGDR